MYFLWYCLVEKELFKVGGVKYVQGNYSTGSYFVKHTVCHLFTYGIS